LCLSIKANIDSTIATVVECERDGFSDPEWLEFH